MALALMGMPMDEEFKGTLPPETDAWRNALGLPSARVMNTVRERSLGMRGARAMNEVEQAWAVWLDELKQWFVPIDEAFLAKNPQWEEQRGRWWNPSLDWEQEADKPKRKPRKTAARKSTTKTAARRKKKTTSQIEPALDYPPIRLTAAKLRQHWDEPLSSELRTQLWDAGVQALGGNEKTARSMLGGLIKEFGEGPVAEAVAKLAVRATRPADPVAYLRRQVSIQAGDDPKAQKARSRKSRVAL